MKMPHAAALFVAGSLALGIYSQAGAANNPNCNNFSPAECGWWWKVTPPKPEPNTRKKQPASQASASEQKTEIDCKEPDQWQTPCGFVDPGSDFDFQSHQRDELMKTMVMNPSSPAAVKGFQRYNQWVFDRAIAVGQMWKWNMVQDPSLDPMQATPVSAFGLKLLKRERASINDEIYQIILESNGFFVWFTRSDCRYCHDMAETVQRIASTTGIPVYNASIDETCIAGFTGDACMTAPATIDPARMLEIETVPDFFLYLPEDESWIRLASGVASVDTVLSRLRLFTGAMLAANENAVVNASESPAGRPSVDFQNNVKSLARYGLGEGVQGLQDNKK